VSQQEQEVESINIGFNWEITPNEH